jgi:hypothetical protein
MRIAICERSLKSAVPMGRDRGPTTVHDVAAGGVSTGDVGAIDPGMTGADALLAARGKR